MDSGAEKVSEHFVAPSFEGEKGEVERVQTHFGIADTNFAETFLEKARGGTLQALSDKLWDMLENTESCPKNLEKGDWNAVAEYASVHKPPRDWQDLKRKMQSNVPVDAPVIAKRGDVLHLVSGNTRLLVARALGIRPNVLIVDITDVQ